MMTEKVNPPQRQPDHCEEFQARYLVWDVVGRLHQGQSTLYRSFKNRIYARKPISRSSQFILAIREKPIYTMTSKS